MFRVGSKMWSCGMLVGLLLCLCGIEAQAQTLSFSLGFPRSGIRDRGHFVRLLNKQIRLQLVSNGFTLSRGYVRQGFHLNMRVSIEEELGSDTAASSSIAVDAQVIMMPQKRMVARDVSASGRGRYQQAAKIDIKRLRRLRQIAAQSVARYLGSNLRQLFRQIQAKLSSLKKGQVLGKKVRSLSGRGVGGGGRVAARKGRPLPGHHPLIKLIPAGANHVVARPVFKPIK